MRAVGLGTSTPTAPLPGNRRHDRIDGARMVIARSSASAAIRPALTPGAGTTSNWVTTGPVVRPAMVPSTLKVRSVSSSAWPSRSSWASSASMSLRGGAVQQLDRRQTPYLRIVPRLGAAPAAWPSARLRLRAPSGGRPPFVGASSLVLVVLDRFGHGGGPSGAAGAAAGRRLGSSGCRSSRCSGCQAMVRRVRAESARKPSSSAPRKADDAIAPRRRGSPGTRPVMRAPSAASTAATADRRSSGVTRLSTPMTYGTSERSARRAGARPASCRDAAAGRTRPGRAPAPAAARRARPAPEPCARGTGPAPSPTGPVSGMRQQRERRRRDRATSAVSAPSRRRASSVIRSSRQRDGHAAFVISGQHRDRRPAERRPARRRRSPAGCRSRPARLARSGRSQRSP